MSQNKGLDVALRFHSISFVFSLKSNSHIMSSLLEPVNETEMQQFCVEMMKRLSFQRSNEHFCDVILEVGSGDDQAQLKAHRIVLCTASPFFYNALHNEMKEKKEGVIRLKDMSKAMMEEVLEYLYTGHVDINDQNAYELTALADYFLLPSLKLLSSKFMQQTLSISNCITAYYSGVKYHCAELQEQARSFVLENFIPVTETEDFLNLSMQQVEEWISCDEIVVKEEEEVFKAVLRWIEKSPGREDGFLDLFRHVRCAHVSRNYLVTLILQHQLVRDNKQCMELVLDAVKGYSDGMEACFFDKPPRNCVRIHENAILACGGKDRMVCYVPSKNKWYKMAGEHLPGNSYSLGTGACQGKLYVVGGNTNRVERYDPLLNAWGSVKPLDQTIMFPTAVTFQGYLYVIAGVDSNKKLLNRVQRYNPDTNLWHEVTPVTSPRYGICAAADESFIYSIGGTITVSSSGACNIVEKFDPKITSWNTIAPTHTARFHAGGVSLHNKIFVFGGIHRSGLGSPCEVYNKETDVWTTIASAVAPRFATSAVCLTAQIFVFGRFGPDPSDTEEMTLHIYDIDKNDWIPCQHILCGSSIFKLSAVRILRDMLDSFEEVSSP